MSLSVGYKWKDVPYSDTTLGLLSQTGNEWHVDADYLIAKRVKLYGYFDYEYAKIDQKQRTYTSGTTANPALPRLPQISTGQQPKRIETMPMASGRISTPSEKINLQVAVYLCTIARVC